MNLKKFRLVRESEFDLSMTGRKALSSIHLAYQANWRASHCEFEIYPMVEIR